MESTAARPDLPESPPSRASRFRRWAAVMGGASLVLGAVLWVKTPEHEAGMPTSRGRADERDDLSPHGPSQSDFVKLAVAEEGPALSLAPVPGRVGLDDRTTANVGAPLSGRVEEVVVRPGDAVIAGDRLFSVRSRDFAELDRERATAEEAVAVKRRLRDRAKELFQLNAVSEKDVVSADADLEEATLSLKAARAKEQSLSVAAGDDNLFWVRSPRAGTVVSLDVFASQEVTPERADPLIRISNMDQVLIMADLPEADAPDLAPGSRALIRTPEGLAREGVVQFVSTVMDLQRQTLAVRIRADNADRALKPNAFVEVTFRQDSKVKRIHVDRDAVVSDGNRLAVFVEDDTGLRKQEVLLGRRRDNLVELRSGLTPGTRYVAKGALLLLNRVEP